MITTIFPQMSTVKYSTHIISPLARQGTHSVRRLRGTQELLVEEVFSQSSWSGAGELSNEVG